MKSFIARLLTTLVALIALQSASHAAITSAYEGNWYDPANAGQGFIFETYPKDNGDVTLVVIFFTYEADGRPSFYTAAGDITGDIITMPMYRPTLGRQTAPGVFLEPQFLPVGTIKLQLANCGAGLATVEFNGAAPTSTLLADVPAVKSSSGNVAKVRIGSGSFRIGRLGQSAQVKRCTGGVIDNVKASEPPAGFDKFITTPQFGTRVRYQRRADAVELVFDIFDLPQGTYELRFAGVPVSTFSPDVSGNSSRVELRFRSPATPFTQHLDFDPLNQEVSIVSADGNALVNQSFVTSFPVVPISLSTPTAVPGNNVPVSLRENFALNQVSGSATGATSNFKLRTAFDRSSALNEFRISVDDAAVGKYQVYINGERRGEINVINIAEGKTSGEIAFRIPVTFGSYPLDFNPRGAQIELRRGDITEFRVSAN